MPKYQLEFQDEPENLIFSRGAMPSASALDIGWADSTIGSLTRLVLFVTILLRRPMHNPTA